MRCCAANSTAACVVLVRQVYLAKSLPAPWLLPTPLGHAMSTRAKCFCAVSHDMTKPTCEVMAMGYCKSCGMLVSSKSLGWRVKVCSDVLDILRSGLSCTVCMAVSGVCYRPPVALSDTRFCAITTVAFSLLSKCSFVELERTYVWTSSSLHTSCHCNATVVLCLLLHVVQLLEVLFQVFC